MSPRHNFRRKIPTLILEAPVSNQSNWTYITESEIMFITKQSGNNYSTNLLRMNILVWKLLDKLLFFIKPIAEYAFGMHIGFALGWLIGMCVGHFYVYHFEPLHLNDLNQTT